MTLPSFALIPNIASLLFFLVLFGCDFLEKETTTQEQSDFRQCLDQLYQTGKIDKKWLNPDFQARVETKSKEKDRIINELRTMSGKEDISKSEFESALHIINFEAMGDQCISLASQKEYDAWVVETLKVFDE